MKEEKNQLLLHHHLKKLKLPTILREWPAVAAACSRDRLDYAAFLLHLVERELIEREQRAAQRRIKNARFPVLKTLESFAFEAQPSINEALIRELMRGEYVDQRENVLLLGNAGTGKTHLATALGFAACAQGRRIRFFGGHRPGYPYARATRQPRPAALHEATRKARPTHPRRTRLRPFFQDRFRTALRRGQPRLRAHQSHRHHQPAL